MEGETDAVAEMRNSKGQDTENEAALPERRNWGIYLRKVSPLLCVQGVLILLEAGAEDFGTALLGMAYSFAILNLVIMHKKERFFGSADFRRWCVVASIMVSVVATMLAPYIPWGWMRR